MWKHTLATLALLSAVSAQSVTSSIIIPGFGSQEVNILASIKGSDATATTYVLNCGSDSEAECGIPESLTFTQGPSTIAYELLTSIDGEVESGTLGCQLTTDHGVCSATQTITFSGSTQTTSYTTSYSAGDALFQGQVITITAGAAASSTKAAASTTKGSSTATSTPTQTGSAASGNGVSSTAASTGSSTKSSTGGMALVTGKPQWALGGAAAALALAAL